MNHTPQEALEIIRKMLEACRKRGRTMTLIVKYHAKNVRVLEQRLIDR